MTRSRWIAVVAVAVAAWSPAVPTGAATASAPVAIQAQEADDGVRIEASSSFRVDPEGRAIRVAMDVTVTNELPDRYTSTSVSESYLPELPIGTLAEATNFVAAKDDGTALAVRVEPTDVPEVVLAWVDLSPDLLYRDTQRLRLTYDLPDQPPRSPRLTRVNDGFAAVLPFAYGDPGLSSVEVVVPDRFDVEVEGSTDELAPGDDREGAKVWAATAIAAPAEWVAVVVGRDPDRAETREVDADGLDVQVQAWPGDSEWADFVEAQLREGFAELDDLIGLPRPDRGRLSIIETVAPYLYGFAGWYDPVDHAIAIGDELDARTVLHELSHLWFNEGLVSQRWIGEAFAEEYSTRALARLGEPLADPGPIVPGPGALPLNQWSEPVLFDEQSHDKERYGYNTAWSILRTVTDEIGIDRLSGVLDVAAAHEVAYRGDREPERWNPALDWRRLLDLLEEVGGSERAGELFAAYVVTPEEAPLLVRRAEARRSYAALDEEGQGWAPPVAVRAAMGGWDFGEATSLIDRALGVLERRDELAQVLEPIDVALPAAFEEAYEEGRGNLRGLAREADDYLDVAAAVVEADVAADAGDGFWGGLGLLGRGPGDDVDRAVTQFGSGDLDGARESAAAAIRVVDRAPAEGRRRALIALAVVALAVALLVWRRHARRWRLEWEERARAEPPLPGASRVTVGGFRRRS